MATENVKIVFTSDTSGLNQALAGSKTLEAELKKAGVAADQMDVAIDEVGKTLKEAGVDAGKFAKELDKSSTSTKTLRAQLAEAKNEAVRISQAFGPFSQEARKAAQAAAKIKDEVDDLNATINALNPDAKLNAFVNLGQGVQGAFQAATGALQVFGVENERITKLAQQFQGVLNLTQGINSVLQLKDVYTQLRLVLGVTTAAQSGLTAATTGAAGATAALNTGLAATAVAAAPVVAVVGTLIAISYVLTESLYDEAEAQKAANEERQRQLKLLDEAAQSYLDFIGINEKYYALLKAQGKTELEIAQVRIKNIDSDLELLRIGRDKANDSKIKLEFDQKINDLILDRQILELEINKLLREQAVLADQAKNKFEKAQILPNPKEVAKQTGEVLDVIGKTITERASELPLRAFFSDEELQQRKDAVIDTFNEIFDAYGALSSAIVDLQQAGYEQDLRNLKQSKDDGYLTEEQYNTRVAALRKKQFEANKKYQIAQAIMGTAQGIINALGTTPPEAVPAAIALATALGALQIGKILSVDTPTFKKGTLDFQGGNMDADGGRLAILHPHEAVIPAKQNREYHPTIAALFNNRIKASEINGFVEARLKGRIPTSVEARIDHNKLGRALSGQKAVEVTNARVVGRIIASEISKTYDPRR